MGLIENDPRKTAYLALYCAIKWHRLIEPETALRLANGHSMAKPGVKITPELRQHILKLMENPTFKSFNAIERKYKVNRYDIIQSEEAYTMGQIEKHLKQLKTITETCTGDCGKCFLDNKITEDITFCEFIQDMDIQNPQIVKNRALQKTAINCNLDGATKTKGFEVYESVLDEFNKYVKSKKDKKVRDIVSAALAEYISRHK